MRRCTRGCTSCCLLVSHWPQSLTSSGRRSTSTPQLPPLTAGDIFRNQTSKRRRQGRGGRPNGHHDEHVDNREANRILKMIKRDRIFRNLFFIFLLLIYVFLESACSEMVKDMPLCRSLMPLDHDFYFILILFFFVYIWVHSAHASPQLQNSHAQIRRRMISSVIRKLVTVSWFPGYLIPDFFLILENEFSDKLGYTSAAGAVRRTGEMTLYPIMLIINH